jgi:nitrate reductase NapD
MTRAKWSVSGLCITARPESIAAVEAVLGSLPGVEVHGSDPHSGRLIVVQEGSSVEDHQAGLRKIQAVPGVLTADLVMHYEDPEGISRATATGVSA